MGSNSLCYEYVIRKSVRDIKIFMQDFGFSGGESEAGCLLGSATRSQVKVYHVSEMLLSPSSSATKTLTALINVGKLLPGATAQKTAILKYLLPTNNT
jgi:hypothetical protein